MNKRMILIGILAVALVLVMAERLQHRRSASFNMRAIISQSEPAKRPRASSRRPSKKRKPRLAEGRGAQEDERRARETEVGADGGGFREKEASYQVKFRTIRGSSRMPTKNWARRSRPSPPR